MKDLRLLIQSRYPILYVESYEEERLAQRLAQVCGELRMPFFTWSVSEGLQGGETYSLDETRQPAKLLEQIRAQQGPALYLLRDFHPFLSDPAVVRSLRDLAQDSERLVTVVLCSPALEIPMELRKVAARYELQLPGENELRACVLETFNQLKLGRTLRYAGPPQGDGGEDGGAQGVERAGNSGHRLRRRFPRRSLAAQGVGPPLPGRFQ